MVDRTVGRSNERPAGGAHSHEVLGHLVEARRYYDLAAEGLDEAPDGRYGSLVRGGIENGRKRVGSNGE